MAVDCDFVSVFIATTENPLEVLEATGLRSLLSSREEHLTMIVRMVVKECQPCRLEGVNSFPLNAYS